MRFSVSISSFLRSALLLTLSVALLSGCDLFGDDDEEALPALETTNVFVANGGNFTDQNGTITVFDPASGEATTPPDLELNAFVHSLRLRDGRLYAQLNTDFSVGRVDVFDVDSFARAAQSEPLGATRDIAFSEENDSTRAFVSELAGTVQRLDPATGEREGAPIDVGPSTSELVVAEEKVFATIPDSSLALGDTVSGNGSRLAVFDVDAPSTPPEIRHLSLPCDGPRAIVQDEEGDLAVTCTGRTTFNSDFEPISRTNGTILFVDPGSETVVNQIPLDVQLGTITATQVAHYDPASELLHAVSTRSNNILRVDTDANAPVGTIAVPEDSSLTGIAATAFDGLTRRLYVARTDVQDPFQSAGTVLVLDAGGNELNRFSAGPAPSHIAIRREER